VRPGGEGGPPALTHVDARGAARMVDVGAKPATERFAAAEGAVRMSAAAYALVAANALAKGDVLAVARVAGLMAAKRTADLIPLCHPVPLSHADVELALDESLPGVRVRATATTVAGTGVEMEALTAATVAMLTVYDMVKGVDRGTELAAVRVVEKRGGRSGHWVAARTAPEDLSGDESRMDGRMRAG
jgi:cyclic pyranopterin phosphate synthase